MLEACTFPHISYLRKVAALPMSLTGEDSFWILLFVKPSSLAFGFDFADFTCTSYLPNCNRNGQTIENHQ